MVKEIEEVLFQKHEDRHQKYSRESVLFAAAYLKSRTFLHFLKTLYKQFK